MATECKRHVLIAVDGSTQARNAFEWYLDNCHKEGDNVSVITVSDMSELNIGMYIGRTDDKVLELSKKVKEAEELTEHRLSFFTQTLKKKSVKGSSKALPGSSKPGEAICHFANEEKVKMIVMGTRGLSKLRRTFLGSVSDYVVHHAHCPVVVVPFEGGQEAGCQPMDIN